MYICEQKQLTKLKSYSIMKRTLTAILLSLSGLMLWAQPQRSGFRQLLSYGCTPVNARTVMQVMPLYGFTPEEAQRYGFERLLDDLRTVVIPYYRPTLTFDDINFILSVFKSPDVRQALRHLEFMDDLQGAERSKYLNAAIADIQAGKTPEPVKLNEGIRPEFVDAVKAYLVQSGSVQQWEDARKGLTEHVDPNNEGQKIFVKILDYVGENRLTVETNMAFGKVTLQELKLITSLYETQAFQHFRAGNQKLSLQSREVLPKIMEMAQQWKAGLHDGQ